MSSHVILQCTAQGTPRAVASAIEACAAERRAVTALVVPWESDDTSVQMAVTVTTGEGWALEHTNLGTITLTGQGDRTRVSVVADESKESDRLGVLTAFARQLEQRLGSAPAASRPRQ